MGLLFPTGFHCVSDEEFKQTGVKMVRNHMRSHRKTTSSFPVKVSTQCHDKYFVIEL